MCLGDFNAISTLFLKLGGIQCLKPTNRNTHKLLKTPYFSDLVIDASCSWHFGLNTDLRTALSITGHAIWDTDTRDAGPGHYPRQCQLENYGKLELILSGLHEFWYCQAYRLEFKAAVKTTLIQYNDPPYSEVPSSFPKPPPVRDCAEGVRRWVRMEMGTMW